MDRITTHGRFSADTIFTASEVFPDPLEPAIPIIFAKNLALNLKIGYDSII
jgi:hypothetical protein